MPHSGRNIRGLFVNVEFEDQPESCSRTVTTAWLLRSDDLAVGADAALDRVHPREHAQHPCAASSRMRGRSPLPWPTGGQTRLAYAAIERGGRRPKAPDGIKNAKDALRGMAGKDGRGAPEPGGGGR